MQVASDILKRLRTDTADLHERVELQLPFFSPDFDLQCYARVLESFYGYWSPVEQQLSRVEALAHPDLSFNDRMKSHLLEVDLRLFGIDPAGVLKCTDLPRTDTFGRALGCLYVLEGSTLGSQVIAKRLRERFQLHRQSGASFFNAYGASMGTRWAEFRLFVLRYADNASADELVTTARDTFACFHRWLGLRKQLPQNTA